MTVKKCLVKALDLQQTIAALAQQIAVLSGAEPFALVGIRSRGVPLAERILAHFKSAKSIASGALDITLYRDDLSLVAENPIIKATEIDFVVDGARIWLVDDVLYTGRTIRAALDALMDLGRPQWVKLAVLVDRGGRQLPIQADAAGITSVVAADEMVQVALKEIDGQDGIWIVDKGQNS